MMKKIIIAIVLFVSLFTVKVNAEELSIKDLPKSYVSGDFEYDIEGFEIRIYDATNDSNGNSKYFSDNTSPIKTIEIADEKYKINPAEYNGKYAYMDGTFININLSITENEFENLVKEGLGDIEDNTSYIAELVVKYKFTKIPEKYVYKRYVSLLAGMRTLLNNGNTTENIEINTTTSQIINAASLKKENGKENFMFDESYALENGSINSSFSLFDYAFFVDQELEDGQFNSMEGKDSYVILFHNLDNIEEALATFNKSYEESLKDDFSDEKNDDINNAQVVKVGNTRNSIPYWVYMLSVSLIVVGTTIVIRIIKNMKTRIGNDASS